jgi:hypothetical protein
MNNFISFTFQGSRAGFFQGGLQPQYFLTELMGEFLYNNPLVFIAILLSVIAVFRKIPVMKGREKEMLLLLWSLPLIITFLFLSLFRQTLPHWTGPAYTTLIFLAAGYLVRRQERSERRRFLPAYVASALGLLLIVIIVGILQVNHGVFYTGQEEDKTQRGRNDVSLDMYGWDQVRGAFSWLASDDASRGVMPERAPIVTFRWFPAANLDYYVARHTNREVLAYGTLDQIHKYAWINKDRGGFKQGMSAYYITTSRDFKDPQEVFGDAFQSIDEPYYFPLKRGGKVAGYGFIYRLKGYRMH